VVTAHSIVSAFFEPAQQAMLPNLVSEADYPLAATLENSLWAATLAVGSALGGVALALVGAGRRPSSSTPSPSSGPPRSWLACRRVMRTAPTSRRSKWWKRRASPARRSRTCSGCANLREGVRYVASQPPRPRAPRGEGELRAHPRRRAGAAGLFRREGVRPGQRRGHRGAVDRPAAWAASRDPSPPSGSPAPISGACAAASRERSPC